MSQRRIAMVSLNDRRLKVVWMDELGNKLGGRVLRTSNAIVVRDPGLLEMLEASLSAIGSEAGLNFQIQAENIQVYEILARNPRIHALLSRRVGSGFIHEEFKDWSLGNVDAQEERPGTRGASDNGITAEEGGSND